MKWLLLLVACALHGMTLDEKVGQLLMVHFKGATLNDEAMRLIDEAHVGGFCYYDYLNELSSKEQVLKLTNELQAYSSIPLIIAVDQEGGKVQRLKKWARYIPPACEMVDPYEAGNITGEDLASCGINLNLAPVLDLYLGHGRSFSSDPDGVVDAADKFIQGLKNHGIWHCLKHFPGHGFTQVDSHYELPVSEYDSKNIFPFKALIQEAPFVMSAHVLIPAIDKDYPVTFSHEWLTQILRNEMQYQGVVMSDSLTMDGILSQCDSICDAAYKALVAGCDMLIIGRKALSGQPAQSECIVEDIIAVHHFLVDCIKNGMLSEEMIDRSVGRILGLKHQLMAVAFL